MTKIRLSPTQELILEVLGARYRLGETIWPFDSKLRPQLRKLESHGLVTRMHGIVENTERASLTEAGRDMVLTAVYVPPVFAKYKLKKKYR